MIPRIQEIPMEIPMEIPQKVIGGLEVDTL